MIKKAMGSIGAMAIGLLAFGLAKAGVQYMTQPKPNSAQELRASAESSILATSTMMVALKRDFPQDFDAIMTKLTTMAMSSMPSDQLMAASQKEMALVRTRYAPAIATASDIDLQVLVRDTKEMHEVVLAKAGSAACDKVFRVGASGVPRDFAKANAAVIDRVGTHTVETLRRAIDSPGPKPGPATDADWGAVVARMQAAGVTEAELEKMGTAETDPNAKDLCPTGIRLFEAILAMPGDAGHRLRADFMTTLVGSM